MAEFLDIQTSYLSQVLARVVTLKEDYSLQLTEFLRLDPLEADYFVVLVAIERASSNNLKNYHKRKAQALRKQLFAPVRATTKVAVLDEANTFERYYASWHPTAIHSLSALGDQDVTSIAKSLALPVDLVAGILRYLSELELVVEKNGRFAHSGKNIYLPREHKWISRHHMNWRLKAIDALPLARENQLHFTSIATFSESEARQIQRLMRALIQEIGQLIAPAKNEAVYCYSLDLFPVTKS